MEVIKGQYHIGSQHPKLSSSQLAGFSAPLVARLERITPFLTSSYNSRNLNYIYMLSEAAGLLMILNDT